MNQRQRKVLAQMVEEEAQNQISKVCAEKKKVKQKAHSDLEEQLGVDVVRKKIAAIEKRFSKLSAEAKALESLSGQRFWISVGTYAPTIRVNCDTTEIDSVIDANCDEQCKNIRAKCRSACQAIDFSGAGTELSELVKSLDLSYGVVVTDEIRKLLK